MASIGQHWTALLPCKPRAWCLKHNSSGVDAWKASIPPLTLDFLAVLVQSSTSQFLDRSIPSLAGQPRRFRFPYPTWTPHAPSKDSLLRHLGQGRLLTWPKVGRHAHVLGRFCRHLKRPPQRPNLVSRGMAYLAALARDRNRLRLQLRDWGRMQKCLHSGGSDLYHEHHILTSYFFFPGTVHPFLSRLIFSVALTAVFPYAAVAFLLTYLFTFLLIVELPVGSIGV
jgi:hypothetical protein